MASGVAASGSATAQKRAGVPSQLANLEQQLRENLAATTENFLELVKLSDAHNETSLLNSMAIVQQEHLEIQARTLAIVRACEKLTEVTAQLKTILVVNDFSQINRSIDVLNEEATKKEKSVRNKMEKHEENVIDVLNELEFRMQNIA
ncbi:mediator of RNA polymerase II transcription subunit 22-like [Convolutriloba macropyga]|uniref:mediator of RNA polymerase II transcription subunit 22-like n=1 Tax=Convolutriloba macropyga TaxID=536237 RepID=UPI003F52901A